MSHLGHFVQGSDWKISVPLIDDTGAQWNVSTATSIRMAIVDLTGMYAVIPAITCNAGDLGASWATGIVVGIFPKANTFLTPFRRYRVEVKWVLGGLTYARSEDTITVRPGRSG